MSVSAHAGFLALWLAVSGRPSLTPQVGLLAISALAMGVQTAAVFSLGIQGVFTAAATATFTVLSGDTAHWATHQPERRRLAALLIALTCGAIAGGLLLDHAHDFAPVLPLVVATLVVTLSAESASAPTNRPRQNGPQKATCCGLNWPAERLRQCPLQGDAPSPASARR
ncbi:MAG TPA: DUF1275 family protein [Solirubrobacteraceae bacterium]|nr:DUF1275 family protein [Solirubrobacteraceae bacterium]